MRTLSAAILIVALACGIGDAAGHGDGSKLAPDKCAQQYAALNQTNAVLLNTKSVLVSFPRPVPGVPEAKELTDMRQQAQMTEIQAAMAYEQARAAYMACEGSK